MKKVIAIFDSNDMNEKQYRQVMSDLEKAGSENPPGRISHFATTKDKGMVVVDLWDSSRQLEQFKGILIPILVKNGVTPPQPKVYPVVNEVLFANV